MAVFEFDNLLGYQDEYGTPPLEVIRFNIENRESVMKGKFESSEFHTAITGLDSRTIFSRPRIYYPKGSI